MNNPFQMMQMFQQFRSNPAQFLNRFNIPADAMNDPNKIINYLMKTNQISQSQVNQAYQVMGQFRR